MTRVPSMMFGQGIGVPFWNSLTSSAGSWAIPRMTNGRPLYLRVTISRSCGIISRHGPHQGAQKLTRTTLPRNSLSRITLPSASWPAISGHLLPTCFPSTAGDSQPGRATSRPTRDAAATAQVTRRLDMKSFVWAVRGRHGSRAVSLAALRATARGPAVVRKPKTGAARRPYPSLRFGLRLEQPALACGRSEQPTTVSLAALRATARGPAVVRKPKTGAARRPYPSLRFGLRPAGRPWFGSHPRGADGRSPRRAEGYGENSRRSSGRVRAAASLRCGVLTG